MNIVNLKLKDLKPYEKNTKKNDDVLMAIFKEML